ncbi:MAG: thioredoxin domain-containing protein [Patescibacteria group bacterium]
MRTTIKWNKSTLYLGLAVIVVLAAIFLSLFRYFKKAPEDVIVNDVVSKGAVAQSYSVLSSPRLKDDDKFFGPEEALLKIFVFEDYTSSYSASLADTLDRIKAELGDKVAVVVRPFSSNSLEALEAARAVFCAGQEGKWKEMRALLFIRAKNKQLITDDWSPYIGQLKLAENNFLSCLTNQKKSGTIEQLLGEAKNYGVQGAPTIFISDELVVGARPYDDYVDSNGDKIEGLKSLVIRKLF